MEVFSTKHLFGDLTYTPRSRYVCLMNISVCSHLLRIVSGTGQISYVVYECGLFPVAVCCCELCSETILFVIRVVCSIL